MAGKISKQSGLKRGENKTPLNLEAIEITQGDVKFYAFKIKASVLWPMVSINRRAETEDRGYQRVLSMGRVKAVSDHINAGRPLPNSVLIALDEAKWNPTKGILSIPAGKDIGWVIDGQHRIAGAHEAKDETDIELLVAAFVEADYEFQIEQFITINREQKGVPTSLVYDLLSHLPGKKKPSDIAVDRAAEIANELRRDPGPLKGRIVVTQSPGKGQISITNFVRKISPLVHPERGILKTFTLPEQKKIFDNYFEAIRQIYPDEWTKSDNIFFKTVGFGAMMNVFDDIWQIVLSTQHSFSVSDIKVVLKRVSDFDFSQWNSYGSGNKAELEAAQDYRTDLLRSRANESKRIRL